MEEYLYLYWGDCYILPPDSGLPDLYRKDQRRFKCFKTRLRGENYVCQYEDINIWSQLGIIRSTDLIWKEDDDFVEIRLDWFIHNSERVYEGKRFIETGGSGTDFYWVGKWKIEKYLLARSNL